MHLDGLNAEHKFRVWVTILGHMSRPLLYLYSCDVDIPILIELQFIVIVFDVNSLNRLFMAAKQNNNL